MLANIKMKIDGENLSYNMGSLFHGFFIENIDAPYADYLHYNQINPISSCIYKDRKDKNYYWKITSFGKIGSSILLDDFMQNIKDEIYLKNNNQNISILSKEVKITDFEEIYTTSKTHKKINFVTPTTYKRYGRTNIFPDIRIMFQGIINKINAYSENIKLEDEKIINNLYDSLFIKDYNLRTKMFYLEKIRIKGFIGQIDIRTGKEEYQENLLNFLINIGEYTGIGIKTTLGMGGVILE